MLSASLALCLALCLSILSIAKACCRTDAWLDLGSGALDYGSMAPKKKTPGPKQSPGPKTTRSCASPAVVRKKRGRAKKDDIEDSEETQQQLLDEEYCYKSNSQIHFHPKYDLELSLLTLL